MAAALLIVAFASAWFFVRAAESENGLQIFIWILVALLEILDLSLVQFPANGNNLLIRFAHDDP